MATRMVGGFILVAFLFGVLLAWPGRQRWPWWLIFGLPVSVTGSVALATTPISAWWLNPTRAAALSLTVLLVAIASLRDLRDVGPS